MMASLFSAFRALLAVAAINASCCAFQLGPKPSAPRPLRARPLRASDASAQTTDIALDRDIASRFTLQVCTSTNCSKRLKDAGLDQYHSLGEIYAQAQAAGVETCMIIEDGGCLGGRNCKLGPCVAVQHEDFVGNVALEGMNSNEFRERVFHNVMTEGDAGRVWSCMENAIHLMADEANAGESEDDS